MKNMARNKTHFVPTNNLQKRVKIITYDMKKSGKQKWPGLLYLNIRTGLPKTAQCVSIGGMIDFIISVNDKSLAVLLYKYGADK